MGTMFNIKKKSNGKWMKLKTKSKKKSKTKKTQSKERGS